MFKKAIIIFNIFLLFAISVNANLEQGKVAERDYEIVISEQDDYKVENLEEDDYEAEILEQKDYEIVISEQENFETEISEDNFDFHTVYSEDSFEIRYPKEYKEYLSEIMTFSIPPQIIISYNSEENIPLLSIKIEYYDESIHMDEQENEIKVADEYVVIFEQFDDEVEIDDEMYNEIKYYFENNIDDMLYLKEIEIEKNNNNIKVNDGEIENQFKEIQNTIYVPLREVANNFGFNVNWEDSTKSVEISDIVTTSVVKQNSNEYVFNNRTITLDNPAINFDGHLYVPIEYFSKVLGKTYSLDDNVLLISNFE